MYIADLDSLFQEMSISNKDNGTNGFLYKSIYDDSKTINLKQNFIDSCKNIINLHNSPLPKYRGVRPINWALKNGEHSHGVTIH